MSRYVKEFSVNADPQYLHSCIDAYLTSKKYKYIVFDDEYVFKKGEKFFKFSYPNNKVVMETWKKKEFFFGLYACEYGTPKKIKGKWRKVVSDLENILAEFSTNVSEYTVDDKTAPVQNQTTHFCTACGATVPQNSRFCTACGKEVTTADNVAQNYPQDRSSVTLREFIEKYAPQSVRGDIARVAILCYVCGGATFVMACLFNIWGIIDALLMLGFAFCMHFFKSKVCAILVFVLSIAEVAISISLNATPPIWWFVAGIFALRVFKKATKLYKQFLSGN